MRKILTELLVLLIFVGGMFAQSQPRKKAVEFNLNLGVMKNIGVQDPDDSWWGFAVGWTVDINLGRFFMICPEVSLLIFPSLFLTTGTLLNLRIGRAFVGAGPLLPLDLSHGVGDPVIKLNAGYRNAGLILVVFLIPKWEEWNVIGVSIGWKY